MGEIIFPLLIRPLFPSFLHKKLKKEEEEGEEEMEKKRKGWRITVGQVSQYNLSPYISSGRIICASTIHPGG